MSEVCDYPSSNSITLQYWKLQGDEITLGRIFASFLLLFELIGLPWNVLVVIVIVKEKLYHQPAVILLLNLIITDFFNLLLPTPLLMTTGFAGEQILGSTDRIRCITCRLEILLIFSVYNSIFTVALMSLDRFFYIYKPLQYERVAAKRVSLFAILVAILLSISLCIIIPLAPGTAVFIPYFLVCYPQTTFLYPVILITVGAAGLCVIIVSNLWFSVIVLKTIRKVYSKEDICNTSKLYRFKKSITSARCKKQSRLYRVLCALVITSLITWLPLFFLLLVPHIHSVTFPIELITASLILHYSQVILHPVLETMLIVDIRKPMKNLIARILLKKKDHPLEEGYESSKSHHEQDEQSKQCCFFTAILLLLLLPQS